MSCSPGGCLPCSHSSARAPPTASHTRKHTHTQACPDPRRLPPSILAVELSCIRDTLPPQLSQLHGLQSLAVRRGLVSEGVLLTEYECLAHLAGLRSRRGLGEA